MNKSFDGVAVYPRKVRAEESVLAGVWFAQPVSCRELGAIMHVAKRCKGEMEVCSKGGVTTLTYRVSGIPHNRRVTRQVGAFLAKLVKRATGVQATLSELENTSAVSRALAVT